MIQLRAAQRLKHYLKSRASVDQDTLELLIHSLFSNVRPVSNMSQREKVDMRLPFPYAEVYRTDIMDNMMYVSVNADTYQMWCCVFVNSRIHKTSAHRAFVQDIHFGVAGKTAKQAMLDAQSAVNKRIAKWLETIGE